LIDVGDVLEGETVVVPFTIENISEYPFAYNLQQTDHGDQNVGGFTEFHFVPGVGTVAPGTKQVVECHFSPDHHSSGYTTRIQVGDHTLRFAGRCHARQMFLTTELDMPESGDEFTGGEGVDTTTERTSARPTERTDRTDASTAGEALSKDDIASLEAMDYQNPLSFLEAPIRAPLLDAPKEGTLSLATADDSEATVTLVFDASKHSVKECDDLKQEINIGACDVGGGGGSFEIRFLEPKDKTDAIWKVSQETGAVKDGRTPVSLVFDKAAYVTATHGAGGNVLASMVGQWVTCDLQVHLKGGMIPQGREAVRVVDLTLKTYIDVSS